jgi:hypothetical protein
MFHNHNKFWEKIQNLMFLKQQTFITNFMFLEISGLSNNII